MYVSSIKVLGGAKVAPMSGWGAPAPTPLPLFVGLWASLIDFGLAYQNWHTRIDIPGLAYQNWHTRIGIPELAYQDWHTRIGIPRKGKYYSPTEKIYIIVGIETFTMTSI